MEQHEALSTITTTLVATLSAGWQRLVLHYEIENGQVRVGAATKMVDGSHVKVPVPKTLAPHFRRLREGDNWHGVDLIIDPPDTFHAQFHR